jgi:hypothetical protein
MQARNGFRSFRANTLAIAIVASAGPNGTKLARRRHCGVERCTANVR